jgi:hypothetical protein
MNVKELFREVYIGDIDLSYRMLKRLPDVLPIEIVGTFKCEYNGLDSLVGCPRIISGCFYLRGNQLRNLVGGPIEVGGNYICTDNNLESLDGLPRSIGGNFYYSYKKWSTHIVLDEFKKNIRSACKIRGEIILN